MSFQEREHQAVFSYLKSLNFHFLPAWVIECINYYKSVKPNISLEELKSEVKQQWLLVDLRKIKIPSLPPNLTTVEKINLNGKYAVQVESMLDCSVSCYSQLQTLRKVCTENIEATKEVKDWEIKSSRCLVFVVSDGVQELQAMEYEPIKKIRTNDPELLPGFKMIILGPVECRKGMILLKEENVLVCGGEVDTLISSNSLQSVLIKNLGLNQDDFPEVLSDENSVKENEVQPAEFATDHPEDQNIENLLSQNDDIFLSLSIEPEILAKEEQTQEKVQDSLHNSVNDESMDVSDFIENDFNDINFSFNADNLKHKLSEQIDNVNLKKIAVDCSSNYFLVDSMDVDEIIIEKTFPDQKSKLPKPGNSEKKSLQTKLSYFFKTDALENKPSCSAKRTSIPENHVVVNSEPFVYLKQISCNKLVHPVVYTVKAIILTLTKKITIENEEFNLKANITDGSLAVDVDFSSMILEDFLEFSPCEMVAMMKVRETNSAIAERIKETFKKAQEKLISLNCLMKIKFFPDEKIPLVVSLEEINAQHVDALMKRQLNNPNNLM